MKHLSEEQLVLHYYQEGDESPQVKEHLETCASCRANYQELRRELGAVAATPVPERAASFYRNEAWERLRPRLNRRWWQAWRSLFAPPRMPALPRWALAPAMTALVLAAFLAGTWWTRPSAADAAQWRAGVGASLKAELREEMEQDLRAILAGMETRLNDAAARGNRRLLADFSEVLNTARAEDRDATRALFERLQEQQNIDFVLLHKNLETLAKFTDDELQQARLRLVQLAAGKDLDRN